MDFWLLGHNVARQVGGFGGICCIGLSAASGFGGGLGPRHLLYSLSFWPAQYGSQSPDPAESLDLCRASVTAPLEIGSC